MERFPSPVKMAVSKEDGRIFTVLAQDAKDLKDVMYFSVRRPDGRVTWVDAQDVVTSA
jgi:hypothetical protein